MVPEDEASEAEAKSAPALTYRRSSEDVFRVSCDGVEIGSISKRDSHAHGFAYWHWGVGILPLMSHGGRPPEGNADSFEAALVQFKVEFAEWQATIPADK